MTRACAGKGKGLAVKTSLRPGGHAPAWHPAGAALRRIVHVAGREPTRRSPPSSNAAHPAREALPPVVHVLGQAPTRGSPADSNAGHLARAALRRIVRVSGRAPTRRSLPGFNAGPHQQSTDRESHT